MISVMISSAREKEDSIQVVRLKSGGIIKGHIVEQNKSENTITILLHNNSLFVIPASDVKETVWEKVIYSRDSTTQSYKNNPESKTFIVLNDRTLISNIESFYV